MKEGWKIKSLGEICEIARGGSPRPIDAYLTKQTDGINWVKISDATASSKYIYRTEEKIKPDGAKRSRIVADGDFILSNSMSFGRPYIMRTTGCIHDGWLLLRDKAHAFDPDYLYHFLGSPSAYKQFDNLAAGSTVRNLNIDLVKKVTVPLPPLSEQQRIVAILDEAFDGLAQAAANAEKNLKNARELFDRYLDSAFVSDGCWTEKSLCDIAAFRNGINYTKSSKGETVRIVGVKDFLGSYWVPDEGLDEVTIDGKLDDIDLLRQGDILAVRSNGNKLLIGRTILAGPVGDRTAHSGFTIRIRLLGTEVIPEYLCYFMKSQSVRSRLIEGGAGTNISSLNQQGLSRLVVAYPSNVAQKKIVDSINALSARVAQLESNYRQKLSNLAELKQSLLAKAFAGELTQHRTAR